MPRLRSYLQPVCQLGSFFSRSSEKHNSQVFPVSCPVGRAAKRSFDICFAAVALLTGIVMIFAIMAILKVVVRGPVFFSHERIGYDGRRFGCLKFRTMVHDADRRLEEYLAASETARREYFVSRKLRKDPRIIPGIGVFLRTTSLDELPQFINVLRGDMSIVGPRPVTEGELKNYGRSRQDYLSVRPGITGLWQVSGRNNLSFARRIAIDRVYVRNWSFAGDMAIIARTVRILFTREGAH